MRPLVRAMDALLRRIYGVHEFCDDPDCVLRLRRAKAQHDLFWGEIQVHAGDAVLELHLWNEHIPPLPPQGADLAWAIRFRRMLIRSLHGVATYMASKPDLNTIQAIGGITALLSPANHPGGVRLLERLGFVIIPYRHPLGRFGEFWENLYTWWLMWTFNAASLRRRRVFSLRRLEVWTSRAAFMRRYGNC